MVFLRLNPNPFKSAQFPLGSAILKMGGGVRSGEDREGEKKTERCRGKGEGGREEKGRQMSCRQYLFPGNYIVTNQRTLCVETGMTTLLTVRDGKRGLGNMLLASTRDLLSCLASPRMCLGVFLGGLDSLALSLLL